MKKYWIVVANASELKIFASDNLHQVETDLVFVQELKHPEGRLKAHDLESEHDRPGRYKTYEADGSAYQQHADVREVAKIHFAEEIAALLIHAKNDGKYNQLVIIAGDHFYGILKAHFNHIIQDSIHEVIRKDYTKLTTNELVRMIHKDIDLSILA
jgi:protein required for attachment to host cells